MTVLEGIDVSSYQGDVDWSLVAESGRVFAFIKATEGNYYRDERFPYNWNAAKEAGLKVGAYHFLRPMLDGALQADYLHDYVRRHGRFHLGDMVALDIESPNGVSSDKILAVIKTFVTRARAMIDKQVVLYTSPNMWTNILGDPVDAMLAARPLWLADYAVVPTVPRNWPGGLSFWQYSSNGTCPGIVGDVDLDSFSGDESQLNLVRLG